MYIIVEGVFVLVLYIPLRVMRLKSGVCSSLYKAGILTVQDILLTNYKELARLPGVSYASVYRIRDFMEKFNPKETEKFISFSWLDMVSHYIAFRNIMTSVQCSFVSSGIFTADEFLQYVAKNRGAKKRFSKDVQFLEKNLRALYSNTEFSKFGLKLLETFSSFLKKPEERQAIFRFLADVFVYAFAEKKLQKPLLYDIYVSGRFFEDKNLCVLAKRLIVGECLESGTIHSSTLMEKFGIPFIHEEFFEKQEFDASEYKLVIDKEHSFKNDVIYFVEPYTVREWLASCSGNGKRWFTERLEGKSLQDIGTRESYSRENIRLVCNKLLEKKPLLYEDRWTPLFSAYAWTKKDFMELANESSETYMYLSIVVKPGDKLLYGILSDDMVSEEIKDRYRSRFSKNVRLLSGKYTHISAKNVLDRAVEIYAKNGICIDDFLVEYKKFLKENGLKQKSINNRAILARLFRSMNVLFTYGDCFRYYPLMSLEILYLQKELKLDSYKNCVISTKLLFDKNRELMKKFDIRDEYELHNLLRKRAKELTCQNMSFSRMPTVVFDKMTKKEQVRNFLKSFDIITLDKLSKLYCEKYGIEEDTFCSGYSQYIQAYKVGNGTFQYRSTADMLTEKEIRKVRGVLTGIFYSVTDAMALFAEKLPKHRLSCFDDEVFLRLGYRHIKNILFRKEFATVGDAMDKYFAEPVTKFDKSLLGLSSVRPYLLEHMDKYQLFRRSETEVVNQLWLKKHGFTASVIRDFVISVEKFAKDKVFTLYSLQHEGFRHVLLEKYKDEIWLLSSFLRTSKAFHYHTSSSGIFFDRNRLHPNLKTVVQDIYEEFGLIPITEIADIVRERFGVEYSLLRITQVSRQLGVKPVPC